MVVGALATVDEEAESDDDAVRALESFAFRRAGTGRADGNRSCVIAMTISDRNSARKKRLSITGRDHNHRREKGDSAKAG